MLLHRLNLSVQLQQDAVEMFNYMLTEIRADSSASSGSKKEVLRLLTMKVETVRECVQCGHAVGNNARTEAEVFSTWAKLEDGTLTLGNTAEETIFPCDECDSAYEATTTRPISYCRILVLQVVTRVDTEGNILINRSTVPQETTVNGVEYTLKAVLVHRGQNYASGHYVAIAKRAGQWWLCDDTHTYSWSMDKIKGPYLLFYERTHDESSEEETDPAIDTTSESLSASSDSTHEEPVPQPPKKTQCLWCGKRIIQTKENLTAHGTDVHPNEPSFWAYVREYCD